MAVRRVVPNIAASDLGAASAFYGGILGMRLVMDHGWIQTFAGDGHPAAQLSIAREGGSGTPVPDLSIEVDDFDAVLDRLGRAGHPIVYGPVREPWGVRRVFVRDPFERLINILSHES